MTFFIVIIALALTLIPITLFAKWCERKDPKWRDVDFQIWAFGHAIDKDLTVDQIVALWNIKNPHRKLVDESDPENFMNKVLSVYEEEKKRKDVIQ